MYMYVIFIDKVIAVSPIVHASKIRIAKEEGTDKYEII
jgi:hypothetical protein